MTDQELNAARVAELESRIAVLAADAELRAASKLRRQNLTSMVGVLLAIGCILGLGAVTRLGRKLDADALAQIGRAEIEEHLPASRAALQEYLESEAPRLVSGSVRSLLTLLPQVRRLVTEGLVTEFEGMNKKVEEEFSTWIGLELAEAKQRLHEDYPHMGDREQVEMLVADLSANFSANFALSTDSLYPLYQEEMQRLSRELVALQVADPATLTDEQRAKKDIIETMLRLILREHQERLRAEG